MNTALVTVSGPPPLASEPPARPAPRSAAPSPHPVLRPQANRVRRLAVLDGFWQFRRDPQRRGESEGWIEGFTPECELAVPGSWNEQRSDLEQFFGVGWYQLLVTLPPSAGCPGHVLHFGSVQNHARVWCNGHFVGGHRGGCLPFACRLDPHFRPGDPNLLVVEVDASVNPWDLPPARIDPGASHEGFHNSNPAVTYDFFPYGGIPRPVALEITHTAARITGVRVDPVVDPSLGRARVEVTATFSGPDDARVEVELEGRTIGAGSLPPDGARAVFDLERIRLWDIGRPELYRVEVRLWSGDRLIDAYSRTFGLRRIEVQGDALHLNGRAIHLRGFGKHEDFPVVGRGLALPLVVRDFDLLRWIGANSFRTSHYPYSDEWYDFADRHGVLVIGETPLVGLCQRLFESAEVLERALGVLGEMIERDRHHPSVIAWSVANEPWIESPEGEAFLRALIARARSLDGSRPVTYAAHMDPARNAPCADCDFVSLNKYAGWYEMPGDIAGGTARLGEHLDAFRAAFGKPLLLAEFGADAIPGMHTLPAVMFSEEFQAEIIVAQIREAQRRPWVIGTHVWAFADFKTGQSITRALRNHKGVFTRDRSPKAAAIALHRLWTEQSVDT